MRVKQDAREFIGKKIVMMEIDGYGIHIMTDDGTRLFYDATDGGMSAERFSERKSIMSDDYKLDEWCDTCKEYDRENPNCPRFNKVIQEIVQDVKNGTLFIESKQKGKWILKSDGKFHCDRCDGIAPNGFRWNYCPHCGTKMDKKMNE